MKEVRGLGLLQAYGIGHRRESCRGRLSARGMLINCTGEHVLRFVPPLIITQPEIVGC